MELLNAEKARIKTDLERIKELYDYLKIEYNQMNGSIIVLEYEENNIIQSFTFDLKGKFMHVNMECS